MSFSQAPDWAWAKDVGGYGSEGANTVLVDGTGYIYVAGGFSTSTIYIGTIQLYNPYYLDNTGDFFLAKYDANGNTLWAKRFGGMLDDWPVSISMDKSGNIYMAGGFNSPSLAIGSDTLINGGQEDIFLAKFNYNGDVLWAKRAGGLIRDNATSLALDALGNVFLAGNYESDTISFSPINLINTVPNYFDIFLAKYDTNGNVLWARSAKGTNWDYANSVTIDASGSSYIAGNFLSDSITFATTTLINSGSSDLFLAKYGANGDFLWVKSAIGTGGDAATSVAADSLGHIYMTGTYTSTHLSFGITTLTNTDTTWYYDIFLAKYDSSGNVIWVKSAGGNINDYVISVVVDIQGYPYIAGRFEGPIINFSSVSLTNAGGNTIFITKYTANGDVLWAKSAGGSGLYFPSSLAVDIIGDTYLVGGFLGSTFSFGSIILTNSGYSDMFIAKLYATLGINELNNSFNISVYPNPANDIITILIPQNATIEIINIEGEIIKTINNNDKEIQIDLKNLSSGIYIIKAITENGIITKKFIKQ